MTIVRRRRILTAALITAFCLQTTIMNNASATDITGVTGTDGVYNINPTDIKDDTGFRQYTNFTLSEGDIANLIFKYGTENVSKFVNLVDNTININGIINTMRDGNFYNGHAVFVSPNGMVVGASGVLNVGALSVYTPSQYQYNNYLQNNYTGDISSLQHGSANVTINGKILSGGDINIIGQNVTVGSAGALISGINNTELLNSQSEADVLFNALVNSTGITAGDTISLVDGNIVITTENRDGGINIAGLVKNAGQGDITITNNGTGDLRILGTVENTDGNVTLTDRQADTIITGTIKNSGGTLSVTNNGGQLYLGSSSEISNDGELRLINRGEDGIILDGSISNDGVTLISSSAGETVINGQIENQNGSLTIVSNGTGLEISGDISNNDAIKITNTGDNGFIMSGTIENSGSTALTNWAGDFIIDGSIINESGKMNLSNAGTQMYLTENSIISNNGDLQIINSGKNGLILDGDIENTSTTNIWSVKGDLNINGTIANSSGKMTITNDGNALNIGEDALITNDASTVITNTGDGGLNYNGTFINSGSTIVDNQAGNLEINGTFVQNGSKIVVKNSGDALNINGYLNDDEELERGGIFANDADVTIFNTGDGGINIAGGTVTAAGDTEKTVSIVNKAGGLNLENAYLYNSNGSISLSNGGDGILYLDETTYIENNNGKLGIVNTSESGARIDAYIKNSGVTNITNRAGDLVTNATIENFDGKLEIVNNGNSLTIGGNALITNNDAIKIANTGDGGMTIAGNIENNGSTAVSNWAGDLVISGKIENQSGKMNITAGEDSNGIYLTKEGQLLNNDDELYIQNLGSEGMQLDGEINNNSSTVIYNLAGDMTINGLIQNDGELMISNAGSNLTIGEDAIVTNSADTTIKNTGLKGMDINGTIINENGVLNITNYSGALNMAETAKVINDTEINITNDSSSLVTLDGSIYSLEGGDINITNTGSTGGIVADENASVKTAGNVNLENSGTKGIKVRGNISAYDINIDNTDSLVVLGNVNAETDETAAANLNASNDVNINIENGSLLNAGTENTLIAAKGDLTIVVNNGKIGVETGTSGGGYTYGPDGTQVDTTKSINIDIEGLINAQTNDTNGTNGDYVINLASKGSDMNVDHIKADGRVILLTDLTSDGTTGSILNASTDETLANIEAKGLSLISSGTIGTEDSALTVNDTNYAYKSYYQALEDINLTSLDDEYNKADVTYIISNNGSINAEFTGLARVKDAYSGTGEINITNRTGTMNLVNEGSTENAGVTYYSLTDDTTAVDETAE